MFCDGTQNEIRSRIFPILLFQICFRDPVVNTSPVLPVSVPCNSHLENQPQEQPQDEVYEEVAQPQQAPEAVEDVPEPMNGDEVDLRNVNDCEMVASEEVITSVVYHG